MVIMYINCSATARAAQMSNKTGYRQILKERNSRCTLRLEESADRLIISELDSEANC